MAVAQKLSVTESAQAGGGARIVPDAGLTAGSEAGGAAWVCVGGAAAARLSDAAEPGAAAVAAGGEGL